MRVLAAALLLLSGCSAIHRGAEDGLAVASTPVHVIATPVSRFAEGWEKDPASTTATAPFFVPLWIAGDLVFTGIAAVDLALCPAYAPFEVKPLGHFDVKRGVAILKPENLDEAGVATATTAMILAPFAGIACMLGGYGPGTDGPGGPPRDRNR